jgi:hypothetical protein
MEGHEDAPESSSQSQNVVVIEKRLGTRRERRKTRILLQQRQASPYVVYKFMDSTIGHRQVCNHASIGGAHALVARVRNPMINFLFLG